MSLSVSSVPQRRCGSSELVLPVLGIGCWAFGGGDYWGAQSQADVDAVVRHAVEHGCTFFDTAEAYNAGASETSLGLALRGLPRDRVIVGTKISPSNTAPATLVAHCEASLRRLGTDYIDLYMVHWPITAHSAKHFSPDAGRLPSVPEAFAALDRLRRAGKIRHIGVSNFGRRQLDEALATGVPIVVNELPYSLLTRAIEFDILPHCRTRGLGVLGYMALLQGALSDRYPRLADLPEHRRRTRHFSGGSTPLSRHGTAGAEAETEAAVQAVRGVARRIGMATAELALKWACAGAGITSSLCGARNVAALEANIRAVREPLDPAIVAELDRLTAPLLAAMGPSFDYYEGPANDRTV
jgi:aryl-alcohol dehydrogenase-like predicted oxidoreductase